MGIWTSFGITEHSFGPAHAKAAIDYSNGDSSPSTLRLYGEGLSIVAIVCVLKRFRLLNEWDQEEYAATIIEKLFTYYVQMLPKYVVVKKFSSKQMTPEVAKEMFGAFFWKARNESKDLAKQYNRRVKALKTSFIQSPGGTVQKTPASYAASVHVMPLNLKALTPEEKFIDDLKNKMLILGLKEEDLKDYTPFSTK
jgi:hypothetical protein